MTKVSASHKIKFFLIILYLTFSIVPYLNRIIDNDIVLALCVSILIFSFFEALEGRAHGSNILLLIGLWICVLVISYLRVSSITSIGNLFANILFVFPIAFVLLGSRLSEKEQSIIIALFLILQTYVAIVNIRILSVDTSAQKYFTAGVEFVTSKYMDTNLGSVSNVFNSVICSAESMFLLKFTKKKINKILFLIFVLVNCYFVLIAGSFINVVTLVILVTSFILNTKKKSTKYVACIVIIFILFLTPFLFDSVIDLLLRTPSISNFYVARLQDLKNVVTIGGSAVTVTSRLDAYLVSIKSFFKHPLLGVGMIYQVSGSLVGMHSDIFDTLARYGLIGVGILGTIIKKYYKQYASYYSVYKMLVPFVIGIIFYCTFNPIIGQCSGVVFFLVIPTIVMFCKKRVVND